MAEKTTKGKEADSYGSQKDWVTGHAGGVEGKTPDITRADHPDFYESRTGSENSPGTQGGTVEAAESDPQAADTSASPVTGSGTKNSPDQGGARQSFFQKRDYPK